MPDPISSSSSSVPWCVNGGDEESASTSPVATLPPVRLPGDPAIESGVPPGAAVLARTVPPGVFTKPEDQVNLQAGLPRVERHATLGAVHLTSGLDVLNATAHLGSQNGDGSQGENVGAVATGVGIDATVEYGGWSLTVGLSASLGASVSSGDGRDLDGDGKAERCFSASFGPLTLGECDEL